MTNLHFAQISDIHISSLGDHHEMLSGQVAEILGGIVAELNQMIDLDFVFITGDLVNHAAQEEFDTFQGVIQTLKKPFYVLPGNHDRRPPDSTEGLTRHEFARHFNPQITDRPTALEAQVGYWSIEINPHVQLIGLDSIRDQDWGGIVDDLQLTWLRTELATHADKLVILGVHHPLHTLHPIDNDPAWSKFVCDNGTELITLLDEYPQVKMVLTAHHHLSKVDMLGQRLHLSNPAIVMYPCAYRTFRVTHQPNHATWQVQWKTHPATDATTITEARRRFIETVQGMGFSRELAETYVSSCAGNEYDRDGTAQLV